MKRSPESLLFIGTNGHVRAVDKRTGKDVWEVSLPDTGFEIVSLLYESGVLYAASSGYVFALNPNDGSVLWKNELEGLGLEDVVLATAVKSTDPVVLHANREKERKEKKEEEEMQETTPEEKERQDK